MAHATQYMPPYTHGRNSSNAQSILLPINKRPLSHALITGNSPPIKAGKLLQHEYPEWEDGVNKMYHGVRGMDGERKIELHMEKGDTVFFHPLMVHGSGKRKVLSTEEPFLAVAGFSSSQKEDACIVISWCMY